MQRREFLQRAALVAGSAVTGPALASLWPPMDAPSARIVLEPARTIAIIPPDFMGLGYEISSVARPGLLSQQNAAYVQLVRRLGAQGIIRVGGNTSDYSSYAPAAQPIASPESGPGSVVNGALLGDLGTFLKATGWKLIWGLNLGRGTESDAVAEAKAVLAATQPSLFAFEIGNEPDLFPHNQVHRKSGYDYDDYLREYRKFRDALQKEIPGIPLAGPDVAVATAWATRFARDEGNDIRLLTHHYYREGQNPTSNIDKLLHPDPKLLPILRELGAASKSCGVPYRICETNSFSGGGKPGVSDTFASALWVLDFMYKLASAGCAGVNMETGLNQLGFISSYSPIGDDEHGRYVATPEFYGMLAFARSGTGELIVSRLEASNTNLEAYATKQGNDQITLTLINKEPAYDAVVGVEGVSHFRRGTALRLSAPSLESKTGVFLGGAVVNPEGAWHPTQPEQIQASEGKLRVRLPAASAAIVTLTS
jgi:hypothetical protein